MSESRKKEPIIIPIGFIIDETSLEAAIREAKRRFAEALSMSGGVFPSSYGAQPSSYGAAQAAAKRETEDRAAGIFEREYRGINERLEETVVVMKQKAADVDSFLSSLSLIKPSFQRFTLQDFPTQQPEKKSKEEEIVEAAGMSIFDEVQRGGIMDEAWNYWRKWMTNISGPEGTYQRRFPVPFERTTETGTEEERFGGTALIAMDQEAEELLAELAEKVGGSGFQRSLMSRAIMRGFKGIMGTPTEEGDIELDLLFDVDKVNQRAVTSAEKFTETFEEQLTEAFKRDHGIFAEVTERIYGAVADAFNQKGITPRYGVEPVPRRIGVGATIITGEGGEGLESERVDILKRTSESMEKIEKQFERRPKDELRLRPMPSLPEPTDLDGIVAYITEYKDRLRSFERIQPAVTKERERVEEWGSSTGIDEGVLQSKGKSLIAKAGEKRERRWVSAEDDPELEASRFLDELIDNEQYEEAIRLFGRDAFDKALKAKQHYAYDRSSILAPYRFRAFELDLGRGEKVPAERLREELPPTTPDAPIPGIGEMTLGEEFPEPELSWRLEEEYEARTSAFNAFEQISVTMDKVRKEQKEDEALAREERQAQLWEAAILRPLGLDADWEEQKREDAKLISGTVMTRGEGRERARDLERQTKVMEDQEEFAEKFIEWTSSIGGAVENIGAVARRPDFEEIQDITREKAFPIFYEALDDLGKTSEMIKDRASKIYEWERGEQFEHVSDINIEKKRIPLVISDEQIDDLAEKIASKVKWQQTVGGAFTAESAPVPTKRRAKKWPQTHIQGTLDMIDEATE